MYINIHMDGKHNRWKILFTSMTSIIWKTHLYICTFYTLRLQKKRKNILNICHTWQISSDRENWFFKYFCKQRNEDFTSHYVFVIIPIKKCSGVIIILWFVWYAYTSIRVWNEIYCEIYINLHLYDFFLTVILRN